MPHGISKYFLTFECAYFFGGDIKWIDRKSNSHHWVKDGSKKQNMLIQQKYSCVGVCILELLLILTHSRSKSCLCTEKSQVWKAQTQIPYNLLYYQPDLPHALKSLLQKHEFLRTELVMLM